MKNTIRQYTDSARLMQLASSVDNRPWLCTVYYVSDEEGNIYWLSLPSRRHSQEIKRNSTVAATIVVKPERPVISITFEGNANEIVDERIAEMIMQKYIDKYSEGKDFISNLKSGTNLHKLYVLKPTNITIFDEVAWPDQPRKEIYYKDIKGEL